MSRIMSASNGDCSSELAIVLRCWWLWVMTTNDVRTAERMGDQARLSRQSTCAWVTSWRGFLLLSASADSSTKPLIRPARPGARNLGYEHAVGHCGPILALSSVPVAGRAMGALKYWGA